jgi:hypothetical protein
MLNETEHSGLHMSYIIIMHFSDFLYLNGESSANRGYEFVRKVYKASFVVSICTHFSLFQERRADRYRISRD